jgi:hypothetical protein
MTDRQIAALVMSIWFYFVIALLTGLAVEDLAAVWWPILLVKNLGRGLTALARSFLRACKW